jgi:putative addiction module component (TIGR02574 family)
MKTKELITEAVSLPVEERALLVDSLLSSLNTPESVIDKQWITVAKDRLQQLKASEVTAVSGEEVFKKIAARFQQ